VLIAGAFALHLVVDGGRGGLSAALEGDQASIHEELPGSGWARGGAQHLALEAGGGGDLAAAILGASDPG